MFNPLFPILVNDIIIYYIQLPKPGKLLKITHYSNATSIIISNQFYFLNMCVTSPLNLYWYFYVSSPNNKVIFIISQLIRSFSSSRNFPSPFLQQFETTLRNPLRSLNKTVGPSFTLGSYLPKDGTWWIFERSNHGFILKSLTLDSQTSRRD